MSQEIKRRMPPRTMEHKRKLGAALEGKKHSAERRRSESEGHGGVLAAIREFAEIGMSTVEIMEAAFLKTGQQIASGKVYDSLRRSRKNGTLEVEPALPLRPGQPSKKEREEARDKISRLLSPEVLEPIELILQEHQGLGMPDSLAKKFVLAEFSLAIKENIIGNEGPLREFTDHRWKVVSKEFRDDLLPRMRVIHGHVS